MSFTWKIKDIFESQNNRIAFNQNAIEMIQQQSNFNEQIKYTEAKVQFNDHQDFQKAIKTLEESAFVVDETKESIKQLKKEHKLIHVPSHLLMVVNGVLLLILISKKRSSCISSF